MIALSPFAKAGYSNSVPYTHSSTLRTMEEIFGVSPFLEGAASATDLSDLFSLPPPTPTGLNVTGAPYNSLTWSWTNPDPTAPLIYTVDGVHFTGIAAGTTTYTLSGIAYGSYGCFAIAAYNGAGSFRYTPYSCKN